MYLVQAIYGDDTDMWLDLCECVCNHIDRFFSIIQWWSDFSFEWTSKPAQYALLVRSIRIVYAFLIWKIRSELSVESIDSEILKRVRNSFIKRISACINAEGEQFEHLLWTWSITLIFIHISIKILDGAHPVYFRLVEDSFIKNLCKKERRF